MPLRLQRWWSIHRQRRRVAEPLPGVNSFQERHIPATLE